MRNHDSSLDSQKGLTFVEVLVSVALLAFVVLGVASLLTVAMRQNKLAQERTVATTLATDRLEKFMSGKYYPEVDYLSYKLDGEAVAAGPPQTFTADYGTIPGFESYKRVVTLDYDAPVSGMLRAEARVYWQNLNQGEKSHSLVTFRYPRAPKPVGT